MVQPLWETMWQALRKLNIYLTLEIGIPLLNIFLREIKTNIHATIYTGIITTAWLFTGQNLSQLTCPSTGAWMRKQTGRANALQFSNKKEWTANTTTNDAYKHYANQKKTQKGTYCMIPYMNGYEFLRREKSKL